MFSFGCDIGEPYPLYDISLHVLFFISRPPAPNHVKVSWALLESTENSEKSYLFLQSGGAD